MIKQKMKNIVFVKPDIVAARLTGNERSRFYAPGDRNLAIRLEEEVAQDLLRKGWNVKYVDGRGYFIIVHFASSDPVRAKAYDEGAQKLVPMTSFLTKVDALRNSTIEVYPYRWEYGDRSGVKAYVKDITYGS